MKLAIFIVNLALLHFARGVAVEKVQEDPTDNTLLFTSIGTTTRESGYGHILVPLPLDTLRKSTQTLLDTVDRMVLISYPGLSTYQRSDRYTVQRITERINLLLSLVHKGGFVAKELQRDDLDLIKQSFIAKAMMESSTARPLRNKRSAPVVAAAFAGLASFGTSIFNTVQMKHLKHDIGVVKDEQKLLIEQLVETDLVISNVTSFIEKQYAVWNKQIRGSVSMTQKTLMTSLQNHIRLMLQAFRFELSDFLQGIISLMENRLSPLLINPSSLTKAFKQISSDARKRGLLVMHEDPGVLFQVPTSTLSDETGRIFAVVHLPLYSGNTLQLYRHIPAPFFLDNKHVMLDIESPAEFLAVDTHRIMGKQMTATEFQLCKRMSTVYHCPNMNLLSKKPTDLCLFNLFTQSVANIEKTCKVNVKTMTTHAVQVSTSLYRIVSSKPLQLVLECRSGTNTSTIQGVYMLQLTEECPKASTAYHLFQRTPNMVGYYDLVTLPLLSQSSKWIGEVAEELDLQEAMESMGLTLTGLESVPLSEFRERIRTLPMRKYRRVERHLLSGVLYFVLTGVLLGGIILVYQIVRKRRRLFFRSNTNPSSQATAPTARPPPRTSDYASRSLLVSKCMLRDEEAH